MKFVNVAVERTLFYAIGLEEASGRFYLSIPVSNGRIEYSEHYEIDRDTFQRFRMDLQSAEPFATQCRLRQMDALLMEAPQEDRGTAI